MKKIYIQKSMLFALLGASLASPIYGSGSSYYGSGQSSGSYSQGYNQPYSYHNPQPYQGYGQGGSSGSGQSSGAYPQNYGSGGSTYPYQQQQGHSGYSQSGSSYPGQSSGASSQGYGGGSQYPYQQQQGPSGYGQGGSSHSYQQPQAHSGYGQSGSSHSGQSSGTYPPTSASGAQSNQAKSDVKPLPTPPGPSSKQGLQPPQPIQQPTPSSATQSPERPKTNPPGPIKQADTPPVRPSTALPKLQQSSVQHGKGVISDAITQQKGLGDEGIKKRVGARSDARTVQRKTKAFQKGFLEAMEHVKLGGKIVSGLAAASGDPHAKMAAAALNVGLLIFEQLGDKTASFVIGAARFYERSQEIVSSTEVLIEDAVKLQDKIKVLDKAVKELSEAGKTPQPSTSSSSIVRGAKGAANSVVAAKNKVVDFVDPFTNEKAQREAKLKEAQNTLAIEKKEYEDIIKLIEIKILQESLKEINRKINLENTIIGLQYATGDFYESAKANVSSNKRRAKKQLKKIEEKREEDFNNLKYYEEFQKKPTETPEQLKNIRDDISKKINDIANTTKLADARYLQERVGGMSISPVDNSTIAAIYREIDAIQNTLMQEIDRLNAELDDSDESTPSTDK
jgi:hypothetical protein